MIRQSGMAENFDAIIGSGLRDGAYTWIPSIFLAHTWRAIANPMHTPPRQATTCALHLWIFTKRLFYVLIRYVQRI
jgi:hypothetical protein